MTIGDSHIGSNRQHRLSDQVSANTFEPLSFMFLRGIFAFRRRVRRTSDQRDSAELLSGAVRRSFKAGNESSNPPPSSRESANFRARQRSVTNLAVVAANIHRLPYVGGAFDVAFACAVLQHLADPVAALVEIRRVLKPGGVLGIADGSSPMTFRYPCNPWLRKWDEIRARERPHRTGRPAETLELRSLLRAAGLFTLGELRCIDQRDRATRRHRRGDPRGRTEPPRSAARPARRTGAGAGLGYRRRTGTNRRSTGCLGRGTRCVLRPAELHRNRLGLIGYSLFCVFLLIQHVKRIAHPARLIVDRISVNGASRPLPRVPAKVG